MVDLVGKVVKEYYVSYLIGEGSYGSIVAVNDMEELNKEKVIKLVKFVHGSQREKSFKTELSVFRKLDSLGNSKRNGFPQFCENFQVDGYYAIVLSDEGDNLNDIRKRNKNLVFNRKNVATVGCAVSRSLSTLHSIGFFHADLHEQNLMVPVPIDKINPIKLIDFGLSKRFKTRKRRNCIDKTYKVLLADERRCSFNIACGGDYRKSDDFESLFYILLIDLGLSCYRENKAQRFLTKLKLHFATETFLQNLPWMTIVFKSMRAQNDDDFNAEIMIKALKESVELLEEETLDYTIDDGLIKIN
ncbi:Protein kinase domain-containing protein [Caenorhabditis elegans]|uniref:Protein kinase domain-containing protein n=1 Tax=Caenorhabditis elegans TaxID=6239 RepID=Q93522_CAEEL|nr:Protein kinase domain-containing protein [Caenorhabditis elegans]CAB02966.2 Protein kinase domain-containing protein [Caenorhabditis elegans]|eukprot:NP_510350.2 Uncharacterized protein CELE_F16B12.7 [Caenorhabditis elegans]